MLDKKVTRGHIGSSRGSISKNPTLMFCARAGYKNFNFARPRNKRIFQKEKRKNN